MHPAASGASLGEASHRDFRTLVSVVADLGDGGVYLNVGSAVILPEVFLKAVTLVATAACGWPTSPPSTSISCSTTGR